MLLFWGTVPLHLGSLTKAQSGETMWCPFTTAVPSQSTCRCLQRVNVQLAAPKQPENASLLVAVRVRPILQYEVDKGRGAKDILRVMDDRMVVVMDPDPDDKDYLDQVQNRSKVCSFHCGPMNIHLSRPALWW